MSQAGNRKAVLYEVPPHHRHLIFFRFPGDYERSPKLTGLRAAAISTEFMDLSPVATPARTLFFDVYATRHRGHT